MAEKETKRERFIRVAESRTNKLLQQIKLIGNLSNQTIYDYSSEDIEKIFTAIESELKDAREQFYKQGSKKRFTLKIDTENK